MTETLELDRTTADPVDTPAKSDGKIVCQIDNARVHSIQGHIKNTYPDGSWTIERYQAEFPDAPLFSAKALELLEKQRAQKTVDAKAESAVAAPQKAQKAGLTAGPRTEKRAFHDIFGLGNVPAALSSTGKPISVDVQILHDEDDLIYLPAVDREYVWNIDLLKKVIAGYQMNMPIYLWGMHGSGKTTVLEQAAAYLGRPFMRVQHTVYTEESHIVGQFVVRNGATEYQLGPLPLAMLNGWVYCADEYDASNPQTTLVYQAVLEGKPLVIKDAPHEYRVIRPHPDFRIVGTGNTNGIGDETGLYQGTNIQNAANYSRWVITDEVIYMDAKIEKAIIVSKAGISAEVADKIVKFAKGIRESFAEGKISMTISPRELINAANLGTAFGGNWTLGLQLAFCNRMSRIDKEVATQLCQRHFGSPA